MKIGRNDPCPCGSGKKHKKCCASRDAAPVANLARQRLYKARDGIIEKILPFAYNLYGPDVLNEAWEDFHYEEPDHPFDPTSPFNQVFIPWFFYHWIGEGTAQPLAEAYLKKKGRHLDPLQRDYIEVCLAAPMSFFEITHCDPGTGFHLVDLFTGESLEVEEKGASRNAQKGDILFGKPVTAEGLTTLEACSAFLIPPIQKGEIIDLRNEIRKEHDPITKRDLFDWELDLVDLYNEIRERLFNPPLPDLRNTDGERLLPHRILYDIDSPEAVFQGLKDLNIDFSEEELLKGGKFDSEGRLEEIEFPWVVGGNKKHKSWNSTVWGHIRIKKRTLQVEVNSEKRAEIFKKEMKKRIKKGVRYKTTVIESMESAMKEAWERRGEKELQPEGREELINNLELRAQVEEMMAAHWKGWVHEKVPALKNKTPLQASKSEEGRERLEALLLQFERDAVDHPRPGVSLETFGQVRKELGMETKEEK